MLLWTTSMWKLLKFFIEWRLKAFYWEFWTKWLTWFRFVRLTWLLFLLFVTVTIYAFISEIPWNWPVEMRLIPLGNLTPGTYRTYSITLPKKSPKPAPDIKLISYVLCYSGTFMCVTDSVCISVLVLIILFIEFSTRCCFIYLWLILLGDT